MRRIAITVAVAQAEAGYQAESTATFSEALQMTRSINDASHRAWALGSIAAAQARAGLQEESATTFAEALQVTSAIYNARDRAWVLPKISAAQAEAKAVAGDIAGALRTARGITDTVDRAQALQAIAVVHAKAGFHVESTALLSEALQSAMQDEDAFFRNVALMRISGTQAEAGDIAGAMQTAAALEASIQHSVWGPGYRTAYRSALARIAVAQAEAGDFTGAMRTNAIKPYPVGRVRVLAAIATTLANQKRQMMKAASLADIDVGELRDVLGRQLSPTAADENGWTDLHWAAALNLPELAEALLAAGAQVDAQHDVDSYGNLMYLPEHKLLITNSGTPLHIAAMNNSLDVAKILIAWGADIHAGHWSNGGGWTPLDFAISQDAVDFVQMLLDNGVVLEEDALNSNLDFAAYRGAAEVATLLVDQGADVNAVGDFGRTPLQSAAMGNATDTAKILVALGADLNTKDNRGRTPLHFAAAGHHAPSPEVAEILVEAGADIHATDKDGSTPLHIAASNYAHQVAIVLIEAGANIYKKDYHGQTPMAIAIKSNAEAVSAVLRERQKTLENRLDGADD